MVTVFLPERKGRGALVEALKLAVSLKKKAGIKFNRDADDVYQALLGVLMGLDILMEECRKYREFERLITTVAQEKGEKTEDGVYIWPRHLKEAAEDMGVDWEELKRLLREMDFVKYDARKRKYKIVNQ